MPMDLIQRMHYRAALEALMDTWHLPEPVAERVIAEIEHEREEAKKAVVTWCGAMRVSPSEVVRAW